MSTFESVWKAFESNEISHSGTHYLLAIASFQKNGVKPKAADLSRSLKISRTAVSLQLKNLTTQKLVKTDSNHRISLTRLGSDLVARIASKREGIKIFLQEILGVPAHLAEQDACKVEHLLSEETGAAIVSLILFLRSDHSAARAFLKTFLSRTQSCKAPKTCGICFDTCLINTAKKNYLCAT